MNIYRVSWTTRKYINTPWWETCPSAWSHVFSLYVKMFLHHLELSCAQYIEQNIKYQQGMPWCVIIWMREAICECNNNNHNIIFIPFLKFSYIYHVYWCCWIKSFINWICETIITFNDFITFHLFEHYYYTYIDFTNFINNNSLVFDNPMKYLIKFKESFDLFNIFNNLKRVTCISKFNVWNVQREH